MLARPFFSLMLTAAAFAVLPIHGIAQNPAPAPLLSREVPFEYEAKGGYGASVTLVTGSAGGVQISAWRNKSIEIEARIEVHGASEEDLTLMAAAVAIAVEETPTGVEVRTVGPGDHGFAKANKKFPSRLRAMPYTVDYIVWVPEYTALDVAVIDGETAVDGVSGMIVIKSGKGPVRLNRVSGTVQVITQSGDIDVAVHERSWRGAWLDVATARGDVRVTVPRTFSANIDAHALGGVSVEGGKVKPGATSYTQKIGAGGSDLRLAAPVGRVIVSLEPAPEPQPEPAGEADPAAAAPPSAP